jgi:hypothetical protein
MSKKKKIVDIASDVRPEQSVKHSFHEIDAEFSMLRQCCCHLRKLIEKYMQTLDASSEVISVRTIQRYINFLQTIKDFELSCIKQKDGIMTQLRDIVYHIY